MFDPDDPMSASEGELPVDPSEEGVPSFGPLAGDGAAPPSADPMSLFASVPPSSYTGDEIPPDNEHGDGVRNAVARPCAGIKGNGLLTPKVFSKAEDWRDYNYSDFSY